MTTTPTTTARLTFCRCCGASLGTGDHCPRCGCEEFEERCDTQRHCRECGALDCAGHETTGRCDECDLPTPSDDLTSYADWTGSRMLCPRHVEAARWADFNAGCRD